LLELYPGKSSYQSSIEREQLIALLFDVAPIGNFLPTQMAALDLLLRRFASHYQFSDHYHETAPFVVDPSRSQSAQRWLRGLTLRQGHRFFGVGPAYTQIAALRKQANETGRVPAWLAVSRLDISGYWTCSICCWRIGPSNHHSAAILERGEGNHGNPRRGASAAWSPPVSSRSPVGS
jgi:hypothetical protein